MVGRYIGVAISESHDLFSGMRVYLVGRCTFSGISAQVVVSLPDTGVTFAFAAVVINVWPTHMTTWALLLAIFLGEPSCHHDHAIRPDCPCVAVVYIIPIGTWFGYPSA